MECFALFNIEFCDGEDLMPLYWGFWSVLQVGSLIAIAGVMVQFWIVLGNVETPSWAVALGTPVLVFAALGWVFRNLWKRMIAKYKGSMYEESDSSSSSSSSGEESGDEKDGEEYWVSRTQVSPLDDRLLTGADRRNRPTIVVMRSREESLRRISTF